MNAPTGGRYGALVLSGWVALAPTGRDEAFLMLTTPDEGAESTMPLVAAGLGLTPGRVGDADAAVELGVDGWVTLLAAGERWARPVNDVWAATARARGRVVLVVGMAPMPAGMDVDAYTERYGGRAAIGLAPLTEVSTR